MTIGFLITDISLNRGGERATAVLANALVATYDIAIVSLYKENDQTFFNINKGIRQIHFHNKPVGNKIRLKYKEISYLSRVIKGEDIDLLIGVGTYCSLLLGALKFLNPKKKYIAWEHSNYAAASTKWQVLRKVFFTRLDAIVSLTNKDENAYQKIGKQVFVIPNMVPFKVAQTAPRTSKIMLSVGALEAEKGYDLLINAFERISPQLDWKLKIIGSGSLRNVLSQLIRDKGLNGKVEIEMPTPHIINVYQSASIYVLPSRREGFPMVLLEASECGLPCIAFDCPTGPGQLITHEVNGLLVPPERVDLLASAMNLLATDEPLATKLATAAKENVKAYHPEQILRLWYTLFNSLKIHPSALNH